MTSTPTVTLHVLGALRQYCGGVEQLPVSAPTVRAALEDLERYQAAFREHEITAAVLPNLTADDLKELGIADQLDIP